MRVLIAVTHLLGAGHLTRAAALARAFVEAGHGVVLISGGVPAPMVRLDGVHLVQLPPLHIAGTAFGTPLGPDGEPADAALLASRRALMIEALAAFRPDVVITELFPFGRRALAGEFLALVEAARARTPRPLVLASVRDILVASSKPERIADAHDRVAALYDAVLVHSDPALIPLDASWPLDGRTRAMIRYTGYVDEGSRPASVPARGGVLVAAGSGPAGLVLLRAAAEAARRRPDRGWQILAGHGVPDPDLRAIGQGLAEGVLSRARPDYRSLLAAAALSVSQCGYNTATDLLATGTPAVLVPFEAGGETEQRLRAERLAARGLAHVLPEADLSADTLLRAVAARSVAPTPDAHSFDLGGARRSVEITAALLDIRRRISRGPAAQNGSDLLDSALDEAASRGRQVGFFWRDDDAVTATPALDRLIALAEAHAAPVLLAAIPAGIEPALGRRLAAARNVSVAVHGLAHRNHAPAGEKPAEFGAHRPLAELVADAGAGLRLAQERVPGSALLAVFVPPWNRLASTVAAALPDLGYRGLSAVPGAPVPGLRRVDATLDPIDWRGSRSLRDPEVLLRELAADIARAPGRPVGLLTHHLGHDKAIWDFVEALLARLLKHPAIRALDPRELFDDAAMDTISPAPHSSVPSIARTG
ncbi:glycosyltransferase [Methylobacterium sp. PvR107]|uniref:glycosyltransferase n=1 Tax=Methylobacterium sp. PvR107 TaxID=2806597 RepID=UPI001AE6FBD6|nr:glycosyltransferase [Methylobacterium sp. PvR107]MBP1179590.1 putative glycosyltransferase/peptidoglycan/xylan/chitin deacetylase (PgdA/CDA1 family) [Methylobacterium sp. PvR107]